MSKKTNRVEELVNELETVKSEALANALKRQLELEEKRQEELLLSTFVEAKSYLTNEVNYLRDIRKAEKNQMSKVSAIDAAITDLKSTGDIEKYSKDISNIRIKY